LVSEENIGSLYSRRKSKTSTSLILKKPDNGISPLSLSKDRKKTSFLDPSRSSASIRDPQIIFLTESGETPNRLMLRKAVKNNSEKLIRNFGLKDSLECQSDG
jgi:hypothetical protein